MKAIIQDAYGSPDVLQLREIDKPVIGDDDVLVRVHAAGVDQGVWHMMAGLPYLIRVAGFGLRVPKNPIRGYDVAGRVEAVGENVTRFQPGDEDFADGRNRYDVILDIAGNRSLSQLRRALAPAGTLVIVGGEGGGKWFGGIDRQLRAAVLSLFVSQKLGTWISTERKEDLETLHEFLEAGTVTPVVDRTFPLSEVPEAIRYLRDGHARGKVVITV